MQRDCSLTVLPLYVTHTVTLTATEMNAEMMLHKFHLDPAAAAADADTGRLAGLFRVRTPATSIYTSDRYGSIHQQPLLFKKK